MFVLVIHVTLVDLMQKLVQMYSQEVFKYIGNMMHGKCIAEKSSRMTDIVHT